MSATRASVRAAIWDALATLLPGTPTAGADGFLYTADATTDAQPLRSLHHFSGEISRYAEGGREKGVSATSAGQFPAAYLAFESSSPVGADGAAVETLGGDIHVVRRMAWSVFVAVNDPTGDGSAEATADAVCERIEGLLAGLRVEGSHGGRGVRWAGTAPWVIARRASYVSRIRLFVDAALAASVEALPGHPMTGLDATIQHPAPDTDGRTVPLSLSRTIFP